MADSALRPDSVRANAETLVPDTKPYNPADPVTAAWESFRAALNTPSSSGPDGVDDKRFSDATDAADDILGNEPAVNFAGVSAKLRRSFIWHVKDMWAERLAVGEDTPENLHQLALSDIYTRMLWGAIEDLERLTARAEWDRALSTYSAAHAAATRKGLTDAECDPLSELDSVTFRAMVATPAPDMAALKAKMQIGLAHVWSQCNAEPEEVAALLADVSRLSGEA